MIYNKKYFSNEFILALFLFQYSLINPMLDYIGNSIGVGIISSILVLSLLVKNINKRINFTPLISWMIILILILINTIITGTSIDGVLVFIAISIPTAIVSIYNFKSNDFLNSCYILAYINFFINCMYPFTAHYSYMRFGYGMLLTSIFIYIKIRNVKLLNNKIHNRYIDYIVLFISLNEIFLFGARGAIFAFVLLLIIDLFVYSHEKIKKTPILLIPLTLYFFLNNIVDFFIKQMNDLGYYSYSLYKLHMQLVYGLNNASSGRNLLYSKAIAIIEEQPFFGRGIFIGDSDNLYTHNIFLQVGEDLGIIAMILILVFFIYILYDISIQNNKTDKLIFSALFSLTIGRLMLSSNLWLRPEFWLFVFIFISKKVHYYTK